MGAVADMSLTGDKRRLRSWLLAIAVAMLGVQLLQFAEVLDLRSTMYLAPRSFWAGAILGGLMFGFGMVIASGCGSRSLVNFATGDLKALVGLIFLAIGAYTTLHGLTAMPRTSLASLSGSDLTAIASNPRA